MKYLKFIALILQLLCSSLLIGQSEILIIGTAHQLPEGMEMNYEPLLSMASDWDPQVICTEYIKPSDTLSTRKTYGSDYFEVLDSISNSWEIDHSNLEEQIAQLYEKLKTRENIDERMQLRNLLYVTNDKGNARFQAHKVVSIFEGLTPAEKEGFIAKFPMFPAMKTYEESRRTDEFFLVEFPLAIEKGIEHLHSTDDQTLRDLYHEAWEKANLELEENKIFIDFQNLVSEVKADMADNMKNGNMLVILNNEEHQNLLYKIEYAFMPVGLNQHKDLMNYYYMDRNYKMAMHILDVAKSNPGKRIVAFYGVSHVPFIRKILRSESNHRILTLPNLEDWAKYNKQ